MEACGMCFSRIHVTSATGEPPRPISKLDHKGENEVKSMK